MSAIRKERLDVIHTMPENIVTFPVERLLDNSVTDFDLFLSIGDHTILYSGQGYRWTKQELNDLLKLGVTTFTMLTSDATKAQMYQKVASLPQIQKDLAPAQRINSIHDVAKTFTQYLYEGEITQATVAKAQDIAQSLTECVEEDPSCIREISGLADHDHYTYLHSVRVASYATALALEMGMTDRKLLQAIALGGIFHDIGKSQVPFALLNKSGALTEQEWALMRAHPTLGFDRIKELVTHHVTREIALHHHEKLNGKGYPHGLDASSIMMEVQIATLADIFDALTSSRAYQNKRSRYEALDFIKHKMVKTEVSPEAFKALVSCLIT